MTRIAYPRTPTLVGVFAMLATVLGGCSTSQSIAEQTVTVSAAASLRDVFERMATEFELTNPGSRVQTTFAASSTIVDQVRGGAPVDVIATASEVTMADAQAAGILASEPTTFALNEAAIAVPATNPAGIQSVEQLADPTVSVAVCQPTVPCGVAAQQLFAQANLAVIPVTREPDVRAVLAKVVGDEVDAGVVYRSDLEAAGGRVQSIPIPPQLRVTTAYPIAAVNRPRASPGAATFIEFVLSPAGQLILTEEGFGAALAGSGEVTGG